MTRSRSDLPWITSSIRKKERKSTSLTNCTIKLNSQEANKLKSKLTKFKSIIQKGIRKSYVEYLDSVIFSNDADRCKNKKKLYTFIKHKRTENTGISPLKSEGSSYTDPTQQATILNKQFESVFSKPKVLSLKILAELKLWFGGLNPKNIKQTPDISITVTGTEKLLNLNPNKASGPDKISPRLLKELHHKIAPILTKVFRSSLKFGIVPEDWTRGPMVL